MTAIDSGPLLQNEGLLLILGHLCRTNDIDRFGAGEQQAQGRDREPRRPGYDPLSTRDCKNPLFKSEMLLHVPLEPFLDLHRPVTRLEHLILVQIVFETLRF